MEPHEPDGQTDRWTNEKHVHFLNSMEASFVRTIMLDKNSRPICLDLFLPENSESTLDLNSQGRNKNHGAGKSADIVGTSARMDGRRTRRISPQRYDPSQDQVVPRLGNPNW